MTVAPSRLVLAQRPTRRDLLHGAWWPRTLSIAEELPRMLDAAGERLGAISGVMLNRDEWFGVDHTGSRIGRTKISWYGVEQVQQAVLCCSPGRRLTLLVVPPGTPERVALTATLMACAPGNALTPLETLARADLDAPSGSAAPD
ncbi:MAG: DUF5994 family protein [Jatrophihabitans sp.]|uniref:DUF5994 family protein n=1 Tax=Jatrophihabitans sp. TaxID=1932789 RepID=UPI003F7D7ABD